MKKLLLLAPMLAWSGMAAAQQSEAEADQCTQASRPVIERVDVSPSDSGGDATVLAVDIDASAPNGASLNYDFRGQNGTISGNGAHATWTVSGSGPFEATVEVSQAGSACTAFAYLTYNADEHSSGGN